MLILSGAFSAAYKFPSYSLKVDYTPLFPGVQKMVLGSLAGYGEVVAVWRHWRKLPSLYVYQVHGKKLRLIGRPFVLPHKTPPCLCLLDGRLWLALGPDQIGNLVFTGRSGTASPDGGRSVGVPEGGRSVGVPEGGRSPKGTSPHGGRSPKRTSPQGGRSAGWKIQHLFPARHNINSLEAFGSFLLTALEDKPGWYRFLIFSPGGELLWRDKQAWNGRSFGFAQSGKGLWVSVDNWDGTTSTLLDYAIKIWQKNDVSLELVSKETTNAFKGGKMVLSGGGILNGKPVVFATSWEFGPYGVERVQKIFPAGSKHIGKAIGSLPFTSEKLVFVMKRKNGMDLLIQYEPNKESVLPVAVYIFDLSEKYEAQKEQATAVSSSEDLRQFLFKKSEVEKGKADQPFDPAKFRLTLSLKQWEEWRKHVAKTGHEGVAGFPGSDLPFAHSWKAIADTNPKHTVWACEATTEDYLAGRVKGTRWPYIPFEVDLREPICQRCHPIRSGKPTAWSMYNARMKGNQFTPDGLRAPEQ